MGRSCTGTGEREGEREGERGGGRERERGEREGGREDGGRVVWGCCGVVKRYLPEKDRNCGLRPLVDVTGEFVERLIGVGEFDERVA